MKNIKSLLINVIKPYSAILFLNEKYVGIALFLMAFLNPSVAISGMIAIVSIILFAEFVEFKESYLTQGFYIYNSLLVGMGIGFVFSISLTSVILIVVASVFTFMLSFMLNRLFIVYKIPILSLPFSIVTMFVYLASLKYSALFSNILNNSVLMDIELTPVISTFLHSLGSIFFLPNNIAGIVILCVLFLASRVVFIMAVVGFYFGVLVDGFFVGSFTQALYNPYAFNYILVSIALCGIFLLPSIKNFVIALIGVAISVVLTDAITVLFNYYSIPVFTIPFNITVISFIFMLSIIYYKGFNVDIKSTPEKSLSSYLSKVFRFGKTYVKISLPFSGVWSVYQAFNGEWTHKGEYRFAYDFVKKIDGKTYQNDGDYPQDYYAFGESVLSPVNGYVVDLRFDLPDNIIGEVDRINNWGNYIIIKSDLGFFVEISHLMQNSITLKVGDYVQVNEVIAKCGNSGYSPQPHIHIQVQDYGVIGGFTKEFIFSQYMKNDELILNDTPNLDEDISAVIQNKAISSQFIFILDDVLRYEVLEDDKKLKEVEFVVQMDEKGGFYFKDEDENKLYFYNDLTQFYFYDYVGGESYLKWMFVLSPRLPFINAKELSFKDYLPVYLLKNRYQTMVIELLSTINKEIYRQEIDYSLSTNRLRSKYGFVELDYRYKGFSEIQYKNTILRRKK